MIKVGSHKILVELKGYIEKNWGFPFIVAFMILLSVTAFSLFWEPYDSPFAVLAFYALVAGVLLQLICLLKYGGNNSEDAGV
jgi:hypothetical protein